MTKYDDLVKALRTSIFRSGMTDKAADAIEALQAEQCAVATPLEWTYHPSGEIAATGTGSSYIIDKRGPTRPRWLKWPSGHAPERETLAELKAAAQADYERRILSAITLRPASEVQAEAHAAAIEAAKDRVSSTCYTLPSGGASRSYNAGVRDALATLNTLHTDASRAYLAERDERIKREAITALIEKEGE